MITLNYRKEMLFMKRTVALFLFVVVLFIPVLTSAEMIYSEEYTADFNGPWNQVPLAEPMRQLGYKVTYENGIVTAKKNLPEGEVKFTFNIPKALFRYYVDGKEYEGYLGTAPKIYDGKTYVNISFFKNYVSKFESIDCIRRVEFKNHNCFVIEIHSYAKEEEELKKIYDNIINEYEKYGLDFSKEKEITANIKYDTNTSCESLGINVKGSGEFTADTYMNPKENITSAYIGGNVSGILNIIKLANGMPFDQNESIDVSFFNSPDGAYRKSNMTSYNKDKWILYPEKSETFMSDGVLDICAIVRSIYIGEEEKVDVYNTVSALLQQIHKNVVFTEKNGKIYVTSKYTKEDVNEAFKIFTSHVSDISEETKDEIKKIFDVQDFSVVSEKVYEGGKLISCDEDISIKVQFNIPEVNIPVISEVNINLDAVAGSGNAIKTAPNVEIIEE